MGYAISWVAIKDADPTAVCKQVGLVGSGTFESYLESPFLGRLLPTGWYVVVANRCDDIMVLDEMLSSLSARSTVVAASIEEHVMFCLSTLWSNGKEVWRVQHESEKGIMDLQVSGAPPAELDEIRRRAVSRQISEGTEAAEVDYIFDVPLELAKHLVGFKHDEGTPGPEPELFEILQVDEGEDSPRRKKRWKLW
jgi:hypothetical protein